jgi:hypothetical protein
VLAITLAMLLPIGAMGVSVVLALGVMERHRRARERGVCPSCAYDLTGLREGVCPECGYRVHATRAVGGGASLAEALALPAVVLAQVLLLPGVLALAGATARLLPDGAAPIVRAAAVCAVMLVSALIVGGSYSVRRTPRELPGVMLVYVVGAVDTGIAWLVVLAGPT